MQYDESSWRKKLYLLILVFFIILIYRSHYLMLIYRILDYGTIFILFLKIHRWYSLALSYWNSLFSHKLSWSTLLAEWSCRILHLWLEELLLQSFYLVAERFIKFLKSFNLSFLAFVFNVHFLYLVQKPFHFYLRMG